MKKKPRKHWTKQELAAAGGPMGRMVASEVGAENIRSTSAAPYKLTAWGEANSSPTGRTMRGRMGHLIPKGKANVYKGGVKTAIHEGTHLVDAKRERRGGTRIPSTYARQKGTEKPAEHSHGWIEANTLYNAKNKKEYEESLRKHGTYLNQQDLKDSLAEGYMAEDEYDMGARLMYDPSRGHGARKVAKSAMESVGNEKATYKKYRDQQSYVGRGNSDVPETLKKPKYQTSMSKQPQ